MFGRDAFMLDSLHAAGMAWQPSQSRE
jgi:hypothetical protein